LLTIVTVALNDIDNLVSTIESVKSVSGCIPLEHIIVDGGSLDGTVPFLDSLRYPWLRWVSQGDKGIYSAMNVGLGMARSKYVQFLNSGDLICPGKAEILKGVLETGFDMVISSFALVDSRGDALGVAKPMQFNVDNLKNHGTACVNHQSVFIRTNCCPCFNERFKYKGELCWYLDILELNPNLNVGYVWEAIVFYQIGGKGSRNRWANLFEWVLLVQMKFGFVQNLRNYPRYKKYLKTHAGFVAINGGKNQATDR
jgi:glycosyltransferase involved in cell wall biosynthesis